MHLFSIKNQIALIHTVDLVDSVNLININSFFRYWSVNMYSKNAVVVGQEQQEEIDNLVSNLIKHEKAL